MAVVVAPLWPQSAPKRKRFPLTDQMPDEKLKESPMTPRQTMRALIARRGYTMAPGAYDTLTARLVEQAGFDAVYLTGGAYSRANGCPDLGLLTLSENVRFIGLTVGRSASRSRRCRHRLRQRDRHGPRIQKVGGRRVP